MCVHAHRELACTANNSTIHERIVLKFFSDNQTNTIQYIKETLDYDYRLRIQITITDYDYRLRLQITITDYNYRLRLQIMITRLIWLVSKPVDENKVNFIGVKIHGWKQG